MAHKTEAEERLERIGAGLVDAIFETSDEKILEQARALPDPRMNDEAGLRSVVARWRNIMG